MLMLSLIFLLLSNAVNSQREASILNSRIAIFVPVYSMWFLYNSHSILFWFFLFILYIYIFFFTFDLYKNISDIFISIVQSENNLSRKDKIIISVCILSVTMPFIIVYIYVKPVDLFLSILIKIVFLLVRSFIHYWTIHTIRKVNKWTSSNIILNFFISLFLFSLMNLLDSPLINSFFFMLGILLPILLIIDVFLINILSLFFNCITYFKFPFINWNSLKKTFKLIVSLFTSASSVTYSAPPFGVGDKRTLEQSGVSSGSSKRTKLGSSISLNNNSSSDTLHEQNKVALSNLLNPQQSQQNMVPGSNMLNEQNKVAVSSLLNPTQELEHHRLPVNPTQQLEHSKVLFSKGWYYEKYYNKDELYYIVKSRRGEFSFTVKNDSIDFNLEDFYKDRYYNTAIILNERRDAKIGKTFTFSTNIHIKGIQNSLAVFKIVNEEARLQQDIRGSYANKYIKDDIMIGLSNKK